MIHQFHKRPLYYRVLHIIKRHKTTCILCTCLIIFLIIYLVTNTNNLVYLSDNIAIPYEYLRRPNSRRIIL